jgi:hypothetical protein
LTAVQGPFSVPKRRSTNKQIAKRIIEFPTPFVYSLHIR